MRTQRLLTPADANPKTAKTDGALYHGAILHLAPSDSFDGGASGRTVCPMAEAGGCKVPCLAFSGRASIFASIGVARRQKTARYFADRPGFMAQLRRELRAHERAAARKGLTAVVRLDGTSDLGLAADLHVEFPAIMFYDYTKVQARVARWLRLRGAGLAKNWHLTFSAGASDSPGLVGRMIARGVNVAVPMAIARGAALPATFEGERVIDGDLHDARFTDDVGVVVGLRAKGGSVKRGGVETGFLRVVA